MGDFFYYGIFINMNLQENIQRIQEMMGLNEKLGDIKGTELYHITSTDRGLKIIDSDTLIGFGEAGGVITKDDKNLLSSKHKKTISFSRNKNWKPKNPRDIGGSLPGMSNMEMVFVVDKEKLKTKYVVEPFNWFGFGDPRWQKGKNGDEYEYEERVLTDKIYPLRKYLIDIIYTGNDPKVQEIIDNYLNI